ERFDISSAMVGKHIRSLETRLATRLLTRTTRRQSLTEIGRQYYEQCRRILADVREAESLAEAMAGRAAWRAQGDGAAHLRRGVFSPAMTEFPHRMARHHARTRSVEPYHRPGWKRASTRRCALATCRIRVSWRGR
ncbi:LysR family transcriptional regulator, partial [Paraburkholderia dipogonis]|uniref:LysR family transcriptional regulator n=1 Tax=Paraburkholderia dipogonis TaxID=1211383 RepID=UPI0035E4C5F1